MVSWFQQQQMPTILRSVVLPYIKCLQSLYVSGTDNCYQRERARLQTELHTHHLLTADRWYWIDISRKRNASFQLSLILKESHLNLIKTCFMLNFWVEYNIVYIPVVAHSFRFLTFPLHCRTLNFALLKVFVGNRIKCYFDTTKAEATVSQPLVWWDGIISPDLSKCDGLWPHSRHRGWRLARTKHKHWTWTCLNI